MNRQGPNAIDWTDYTWNPVTGCLHACEYCYARQFATRFHPASLSSEPCTDAAARHSCEPSQSAPAYSRAPRSWTFSPTFHPKRLSEPSALRQPARIFTVSMGDLFGHWVPDPWIHDILEVVRACPRHTFQFLTKRPDRYASFNPWPANAWLGATVTNQATLERAQEALAATGATIPFLSAEPLQGPIAGLSHAIDWLIIGYETGPGCHPHSPDDNVAHLMDEAAGLDIPVWLKNSIVTPAPHKHFPHGTP